MTEAVFQYNDIKHHRDTMLGLTPSGRVFDEKGKQVDTAPLDYEAAKLDRKAAKMAQHYRAETEAEEKRHRDWLDAQVKQIAKDMFKSMVVYSGLSRLGSAQTATKSKKADGPVFGYLKEWGLQHGGGTSAYIVHGTLVASMHYPDPGPDHSILLCSVEPPTYLAAHAVYQVIDTDQRIWHLAGQPCCGIPPYAWHIEPAYPLYPPKPEVNSAGSLLIRSTTARELGDVDVKHRNPFLSSQPWRTAKDSY